MNVKTTVPPRCWYYLLDFNDRDDFATMDKHFGKRSLSELTIEQFRKLFALATQKDKFTLDGHTELIVKQL